MKYKFLHKFLYIDPTCFYNEAENQVNYENKTKSVFLTSQSL